MGHGKLREPIGNTKVKIDKDGSFIIPVAFRRALGLEGGDEVVMIWKDDELCVTKATRGWKRRSRPRR